MVKVERAALPIRAVDDGTQPEQSEARRVAGEPETRYSDAGCPQERGTRENGQVSANFYFFIYCKYHNNPAIVLP